MTWVAQAGWALGWLAILALAARPGVLPSHAAAYVLLTFTACALAWSVHASIAVLVLLVLYAVGLPNGPLFERLLGGTASDAGPLRSEDTARDSLQLLWTFAIWVLLANLGLPLPACPVPVSATSGLAHASFVLLACVGVAYLNQALLPALIGRQLRPFYPASNLEEGKILRRGPFHPSDAGRLIGILERYLILVLIVIEAPTAIALVLAVKSISRLKEFEDRTFVEYFLVGSLVSLLAGMALGFLMLLVLKHGQHVARLHCAIAGSIAP